MNETPHTRDIVLKVKASKLIMLPPIPIYVNPNTALIDDEGFASDYGDNNRNYKTDVYLGYKVIWSIEVDDPKGADKGFDVKLYSISQDSLPYNANFFGVPEILSLDKGKTVVGTIKNVPPLLDMEDFYTIYFGISDNKGKSWQYFPLDPRLRMKDSSK